MTTYTKLMLILALAAGAVACDDETELFGACPLSQTLIDACAEEQESASITCAVKQHPMCDEAICAQFRGSESFCSRVCEVAEDCPTGSSCQAYLDYAFCVPDTIVGGTVTQ